MSTQATRRNERDTRVDKTPGVDASWEDRVLSITPLKGYLLFYNILSCALWIQIFLLTVAYITTPHPAPASTQSFLSPITKFFSTTTSSSSGGKVVDQLRGSYHFMGLGNWVKVTQTLAVLDVVHAALGLVKSNVGTAASQVFSRLWAVWAVVEMVPETRDHPLYTTMILAWSITEIIRYGFYECALLGVDIPLLTWARYNLFMILYPIGASSEAFLSLSTLPPLSTLSLEAITSSLNPLSLVLRYLPNSLRSSLIKTSIGKHALWSMARASVKRKGKDYWGFIEVARLVLFVIWWPGMGADEIALVFLMSHMFKLRAKVMRKGKGRTVGTKKTN